MDHSKSSPAPEVALISLQRIAFPDPQITVETSLFFDLGAKTTLNIDAKRLEFAAGGLAQSSTYCNVFNYRLWSEKAKLNGLWLRLCGAGSFAMQVWHVSEPQGAPSLVFEGDITLNDTGTDLDIGALVPPQQRPGVLYFGLRALTDGVLDGGAWLTRPIEGPNPAIRMAISITTFRREAEVASTVTRLLDFLEGEASEHLRSLGAHVHVVVVDNGQSVTLLPHARLTTIPNANLGGSGGFARGLAFAEDEGFSHCLFMDDDASFMMENLWRTLAFLSLASSEKAAVGGAMISNTKQKYLWENGAQFDGGSRPLFGGLDLEVASHVIDMELAIVEPVAENFYAGWWYFAFPIAQVRHYPFPFFVRGDDVSFCIAHEFDTTMLSGVVSFQDDFFVKETPLVLYLDLRSFLHHHLTQNCVSKGPISSGLVAAKFVTRSLVRMHYESAAAQLLAWQDMLAGPEVFARDTDMSAKRPELGALTKNEKWDLAKPGNAPAIKDGDFAPDRSVPLMKYTLNGHFLPFWKLLGRTTSIASRHRAALWPYWGCKEVEVIDAERGRYTVQHSKSKFFGLLFRMVWIFTLWIFKFGTVKRAHTDAYATLATRAFWDTKFHEPEPGKSAPE